MRAGRARDPAACFRKLKAVLFLVLEQRALVAISRWTEMGLNLASKSIKVYSSRRQKSHMQRQWARLARRGWCAGVVPSHCPPGLSKESGER